MIFIIKALDCFQQWRGLIVFRRFAEKLGKLSMHSSPYRESFADSKNVLQTDNKKNFADTPEKFGGSPSHPSPPHCESCSSSFTTISKIRCISSLSTLSHSISVSHTSIRVKMRGRVWLDCTCIVF